VGKVDIVGFGSYGEVKLARNTENNEIVAIKMVHDILVRFITKTPNNKLMSITN
jgi:serine/threonine protein kinase